MSRFIAVALAALAYLTTLLMPVLPAQAAQMPMAVQSAEMTVMSAPDHCAETDTDQQSRTAHCQTVCAVAHAPALPSQAPAALLRWSRQVLPLARPHARPTAAIVAPDPRPPRSLSAAL
jgi:hypothetical protein